MDSKQEKLINSYTTHFNKNFNLAPLQAKIMAYILIMGKKSGVTFEDVLTYTQASKSSVSTTLNSLMDRNSITYHHKPHDRKKYFTPNKLSSLLERTIRIIQSELLLLVDMIDYYEGIEENETHTKQINNIRIYKNHLEGIEVSVRETLQKLE